MDLEAPRPLSAVFLDRDGVINRKAPEGRYVTSWAEFDFLPGALDVLARLAGPTCHPLGVAHVFPDLPEAARWLTEEGHLARDGRYRQGDSA